jgi:uncharacterized protein YjbI with pentapeptide repeats
MVDIHADDQGPPPSWPTCTHQTGESAHPCKGRQVDGFDHCLAHLEPEQLEQVLQRFSPGADLEAPGTSINAALLERILSAVRGTDGSPRFGVVNLAQARFIEDGIFTSAQFSGDASFDGAQFRRNARFNDAQFRRFAWFNGAQFSGDAQFYRAKFPWPTWFNGAQFTGDAWFDDAKFTGHVYFNGAQFRRDAKFDGAQFTEEAEFNGTQVNWYAGFKGTKFEKAQSVGPLAAGYLSLESAVFVRPVVLEAAAGLIACIDTTWEAGVTMRLRHAKVDLERATFTVPSFVAGVDQRFELSASGCLDESKIVSSALGEGDAPDDSWIPVVSSLRGADASDLSVADVDLSQCCFTGARLLDQLRLEGRCIFDHPPKRLHAGWAWPPVWRWSSRQSLAEERLWRASRPKFSGWAKARSDEPAEVRPERLAGLYRQLRKAQEDAKNEPGAADFYYGEMEMRRHARTTPAAERAIVWLYWLISGYGLRALRPLAALVMLGVIVTTALVGWGLAANTPPQHLTGTVMPAPHKPARIDATLRTTKAQLPPASQRWTRQRTRTALQVTLESIVFRSTAQPLTIMGTWTTIAARILGPILLVLTLLAVRNRVKR